MKAPTTHGKSLRKRANNDARQARKAAFRELLDRTAAATKAATAARSADKYKQWKGAAKRFKGLSEALRVQIESRNIYSVEGGYAVSFTRDGETFARSFQGHTEESLSAAIKFRDEALKILGERPSNIPVRVLKALGARSCTWHIAKCRRFSVHGND